ncbi:MAG: TolC family protein [Sphingobacteriaceae bacterium]
MKEKIIILLLLMASGRIASAQSLPDSTFSLTLQDCINYAYEHQDSMKNARLDIKSAAYKVKETIGIGLPQINGSAQLMDYIKIPTTLLPGEFFNQPGTFIPVKFGVKYQSTTALELNQLLFDGSYIVGLQASKTYKELSQRSFTRTKIQTNVSVTKAYYQVLVSDEQIGLLDANINQLKQQLRETQAQNKSGFVEKIDVDRLTVQFNNLATTRENTVRLLALNYQVLKFQMGMPVESKLVLLDKISDVQLDNPLEVAVQDTGAYHNRIEFNLVETQKKLYELDLKRIKSQFLPSLSAFANTSLSFQDNRFSNLYSQNYPSTYIGVRLNLPIFSGFQKINQVRQADITVQQTQNSLNNLKNALNLEANKSRIFFINSLQSFRNQKNNQELAREVLRVTKIKYEQGVGSSIEVTQAQTALEDADNKYIQALYDALISKVDLEKSTGKIN